MKVVQQGLNIHADCVGGRESGKRDGTAKTMLNFVDFAHDWPREMM